MKMMKVQIRRGVFETNSSSTHNMTICTQNEYNKWINGELYITHSGDFYTKEEVYEYVKEREEDFDTLSEDEKAEAIYDYGYHTVETYNNEYLEGFEEFYTTPSGDKIVVFGQFGYDG